jgi:uncharacterized protein YneR
MLIIAYSRTFSSIIYHEPMEAVDAMLEKKDELGFYIDEDDLLFPGASKVKSTPTILPICLIIFNR